MNCIERIELERFLKGKLAPGRMLEIDEHAGQCEQCKKLLVSLSARARFGAELIGAMDCPEYEELSGYVDESLVPERAGAIRTHANLCEPCAKDIDRIRELRSHAVLREKVTVRPGMSRQTRRSVFVYWKQALAAASLGGIAAALVFFNTTGAPIVKNPTQVAVKPPEVAQTNPIKVINPPESRPVTPVENHKPATVATNPKPAPAFTPVLRDGRYAVVGKGGALMLAKKDGTPVRTALEARVAASIDEKLRTGKIKPAKPVQMAMATINTRGSDSGYEAPPTAPKQVAPMGKVIYGAKPTFTWSAVDLAESYRVRVYDTSGNLVAEQTSLKNSLMLAKPLARGQVYSWRVGARFGETDGWAESAAAKFAVLSTEDYNTIERVRATLPGSHLALGAAYESVGLYDEAAGEYRQLRRANPNSKLAQKLLYGVAGR